MKIVVTGGAGFIGSHLVDRLVLEQNDVLVLDDLSTGREENVNKGARLIIMDLMDPKLATVIKDYDAVFHLAADPDVRTSFSNPERSFKNNAVATFGLLEAMRDGGPKRLLFTSTSAAYGIAKIPTPETAPCAPISVYAASKLACEAMISAYSYCHGIKSTIVRYANIFGERSRHGIMYDLFLKLSKDPSSLEVLGDGKQAKSYLHVSDCVNATLLAFKKQQSQLEVFNIGSESTTTAYEVAKMMAEEMGIEPKIRCAGGEAWKGDVTRMLLDTSKIKELGFSPQVPFKDGLKRYVNWLRGSARP
jgi:UDP-glucose 4-epimerase